ncbi:MAG: hypothetical protein ACFB16_17035 [Phormidesmis sp.]
MNNPIRQISTLPLGIEELSDIAALEGFGMVQTLISNFRSGNNCFDRQGEALYVVHQAKTQQILAH